MNVRVTHFSKSAYKIMPWKNGAGSTTELLIFPPEASVQSGFDWRISLAQVPASGPFSSFPLYKRTIMLLRGDPMQLVHQGHGEHLLQAFQPYDFHGAWPTTGILTGQPVEDFNVMIREDLGRALIEVYRGLTKTVFHRPQSALQFIWAWSGSAEVNLMDQNYSLAEQEALLIEGGPEVILQLASPSSILITVSIDITSS